MRDKNRWQEQAERGWMIPRACTDEIRVKPVSRTLATQAQAGYACEEGGNTLLAVRTAYRSKQQVFKDNAYACYSTVFSRCLHKSTFWIERWSTVNDICILTYNICFGLVRRGLSVRDPGFVRV